MSNKITIINSSAEDNKGDGFHIEGDADVEMVGVSAKRNGGMGFNIKFFRDIQESGSKIYGPQFIDVVKAVQAQNNPELNQALMNTIATDENKKALGWAALIQKLGKRIGTFGVQVLTSVLTTTAIAILKQHGIDINT